MFAVRHINNLSCGCFHHHHHCLLSPLFCLLSTVTNLSLSRLLSLSIKAHLRLSVITGLDCLRGLLEWSNGITFSVRFHHKKPFFHIKTIDIGPIARSLCKCNKEGPMFSANLLEPSVYVLFAICIMKPPNS